MAEYIDREALLELINEDCKYKNPTNEYTRGCNEVCDWAIKTIKNIPTADVVPKSEVELDFTEEEIMRSLREADIEVSDKSISEIKAEVAREIFAEIENLVRRNHYCYSIRADGVITESLIMEGDMFAELKKKYAESENG